ncbi:MAG: hypothetical protein KAR03_05020, partial [Candidatus Thorarchaeota archaeon]|nr:hypothetical protein [Candidatus Thorarchaeota archaeon]
FGLKPSEAPTEIYRSTSEDEIEHHQPGIIDGDSIIISSNIPGYEEVLDATIAKLCLQRILPSDLLCKECIDDISFEFARRTITSDKMKSNWESIWREHSPRRQISSAVDYNPCIGYKWLYSVAGENGLDTFVRELTHRARNQVSLSFEDYLQYFSMRIRRFERTLDSTELKLTSTVVGNPNLPSKDLANLVGISEEWMSRKLAQLQKRMVLRKFNRAPFSRIGIQMFHVLVSRRDTDDDPFDLFKDCPFLYSYRKVVSGDWIALATLCIPENRESMRFLKEGLKRIVKVGFDIDLHQIHSSGVSRSFDYYKTNIGQWDIPWELLTIHLQRIQSDDLASTIPRVDRPEKRVEVELDELDMKIVDCVWRGMASVTKIRSHLKVGQHRVADKLRKLRDKGLIIKSWEVHNIGLNEHAVIYCKDKEIGNAIAAWSLRLPKCIVSFSSKDELMLIADLPKGGSFGLATALEGLNNGTCIGILSPQIYGAWGFPSALWDSKFQRWKCPKKELESWIAQLE